MTAISPNDPSLAQVRVPPHPTSRGWQLGLPELGVLLALFLVWTNAIVVGVRFHGLPMAAGAIVPLLLAVPIARAVLLRGERLRVAPALVWACLLIAVQFASSLLSADPVRSLQELPVIASEGALLYLLVSNAIRSEHMLRLSIRVLVGAGVAMGAVLIYQQCTQDLTNQFWGFAQVTDKLVSRDADTAQMRLAGPIGEVNKFAQIMGMLIPLALGLLAMARTRAEKGKAVFALLIITIGTALAFSRGVAVGLVLAFVIMVALGAIPGRYFALAALAGALALAVVPQYGSRLASMLDVLPGTGQGVRNADAATQGRMTAMKASALMFVDNPIIGLGPAMSRKSYRDYAEIVGGKIWNEDRFSHSLYLGIAAETGLLGLGAFAGVIAATWAGLWRVRRRFLHLRPDRAHMATALLMGVVVYLTSGIFLHASYARYFWLYLGVTGAAIHVLMQETRRFGRVALESTSGA